MLTSLSQLGKKNEKDLTTENTYNVNSSDLIGKPCCHLGLNFRTSLFFYLSVNKYPNSDNNPSNDNLKMC